MSQQENQAEAKTEATKPLSEITLDQKKGVLTTYQDLHDLLLGGSFPGNLYMELGGAITFVERTIASLFEQIKAETPETEEKKVDA